MVKDSRIKAADSVFCVGDVLKDPRFRRDDVEL